MLPVIDVSELPDPSARSKVAQKITSATKQSGFFYIKGHGIDASTILDVRRLQRDFFSLPTTSKKRISINSYNRGYLGHGHAKMHGSNTYDQKEVFFWGAELSATHPDIINQTPLCGPNQWPSEIPDFKNRVLQYASQIKSVGNKLLECVALSLAADVNFFKPYFEDSMLRGQLIHYPPTVGSIDDFGVAPHTDFGCLTLLLQELDGLEVWQDNSWKAHRVRNTSKQERYSIAMFHDPAPNAIIDPMALNPNDANCNTNAVKAAEYILARNKGAFSHYGEVSAEDSSR